MTALPHRPEPPRPDADGDATLIRRALAVPGGHLAIGRGGFTLHYDRGCRMSGYLCDEIKALAIAMGLPVIDSRMAPFEVVARLAVSGPMIAVGETPDEAPYHALSFAPLSVVAETYRAAGAEVFNVSFDRAAERAREGEEDGDEVDG